MPSTEEAMVRLSTYRTDSVARRMLTAFMPVMAEVMSTNKIDTWFSIGGSASNNTASTIKVRSVVRYIEDYN